MILNFHKWNANNILSLAIFFHTNRFTSLPTGQNIMQDSNTCKFHYGSVNSAQLPTYLTRRDTLSRAVPEGPDSKRLGLLTIQLQPII